jgi:hypothetical protein
LGSMGKKSFNSVTIWWYFDDLYSLNANLYF